MRVGCRTATGQKVWRFEILEERIALSVDGPPDFVVDYLDVAADFAGRIGPVDTSSIVPQAVVGQADSATTIRSTYSLTGAGQTVAVIDSGIAWDHVALGGGYGAGYRVVGGWDFTGENDASPYDDGPLGSHGTHVAGIIGADSDQVQGMAPGVDLVALRVFDDNGAGYFEWVEDALQWVHDNRKALANPITTVNLSLGTNDNSEQAPDWAMLEDELAQLEADDIFVTVAAGNTFTTFRGPGLSYPASSSHVVPVMSVDPDGTLSDFSQRLPRAIAAPGRWITSSVPDYVGDQNGRQDDFARYSGTSMASPYVAGASVLVREAMQLAGVIEVSPSAIYDVIRATAESAYDPATGQFYDRIDVAAAIDAVLPRLPAATEPPATQAALVYTDLGQIDARQLTDLHFADQTTWYRAEATRDGLLTVEAQFADAGGNIDLEIYAGDLALIASSATRADRERIDIAALANNVYFVRAIGANDNVDLHLANLVVPSDDAVRVFGTPRNDTLQFTAGPTPQLSVNGIPYELAAAQLTSLTFDAGAGKDWAVLVGSKGNDIATLRPGTVELSGAGYRVAASNVESASVNGRLGDDIAYLHDSRGDDVSISQPARAKLYGSGYHNSVTQFARIYGYASDGYDKAYLYDSAGDDVFHAEPAFARLYGAGFQSYAAQFDRVYGYASDGYDKAHLYDSTGNDIFRAEATFAKLYATDFHNYAAHFDRVYGYASGGYDKAHLYDSAGDDVFHAAPTFAKLYGRGFHNYAAQFDRVYGYAAHGYDKAYLYDSVGNDIFHAEATFAKLYGRGFHNYADQFDRVYAYASDGYDKADLFDSPGNDAFQADGPVSKLYGSSFHNYAKSFERVNAFAQEGNNRAVFKGLSRSDLLYGRNSVARLNTPTSNQAAHGFDRITAAAREGDRARADVKQVDFLFQQLGSWTEGEELRVEG